MQLDPRGDLYLELDANPGEFMAQCGQQPVNDALFRTFTRASGSKLSCIRAEE